MAHLRGRRKSKAHETPIGREKGEGNETTKRQKDERGT
jgi:hypothetical protein